MPARTRSASATRESQRLYLTPQTPSPARPRALIDMTPLPSLFDKIIEASKRKKRSTSLQLESKVDNPFALPSIPEDPEIEDEPEPQSMVYEPLITSDHMDYEDTPIVFSEPHNPIPSLVPTISPRAPATPFVYGEAVTSFFPFNKPHINQHPAPLVAQPPTNLDPLRSELNNLVTFPTTCFSLPSTSVNPNPYFLPQEHAPFPLPRVNEQPQQVQVVEHDTVYTQYLTLPPPTCSINSPILSLSAPVENTIRPVVPPVLAQSFLTFTAGPGPNRRVRGPSTLGKPPPALAEPYHRPIFVPQAQQRSEIEDILARWPQRCKRLPSWRIREIERQREMDKIAEPYLVRLREVSHQKKVEAEARAFAGKRKTYEVNNEPRKSWWDFSREDEQKIKKELTEVKRQQRSEERRQTRKNSREKMGRSNSNKNAPPEDLEQEVSVSPRRKSAYRSNPYSVPHPTTRTPRRSHIMPGGLDSDDLMLGN